MLQRSDQRKYSSQCVLEALDTIRISGDRRLLTAMPKDKEPRVFAKFAGVGVLSR
jgi:hypothetical protein